jgi:hypothetical protein
LHESDALVFFVKERAPKTIKMAMIAKMVPVKIVLQAGFL